ncbi:hypothetical protein KKG51_00495 [Patescibacteria group bacterium]|nr:hypothetical protein [Patescibacteria group bacterium]
MAIASVMGPVYLVLGLSLLFYGEQWRKIMKGFRNDHFAMLPVMLMLGVFGFLIVNMYNVWGWNVWLLVTLNGWGMVLKFVFYTLAPASWIKGCLSVYDTKWMVYVAAVGVLLMGLALSYYSYMV